MKNLWRMSGRIVFWLSWPILFFRLQSQPRTRVLIISDEEIVLVKGLISDGKWGLPGGGLHKGESFSGGAKREVLEETGLNLSEKGLISLGRIETHIYKLHFSYEGFVIKLPKKLPVSGQRFEITDIAWIKLEDIPKTNINEATKEALRRWKQLS